MNLILALKPFPSPVIGFESFRSRFQVMSNIHTYFYSEEEMCRVFLFTDK